MRRPHLVMCALTFGGGGAENQVQRLSLALGERFRVTVLTGKPQAGLVSPAAVDICSVVNGESVMDKCTRAHKVLAACRALAPDVVYSRYINFNLTLAWARKRGLLACPLVVQEIIQPSTFFRDGIGRSLYAYLMRQYYPYADLVLGNGTRIVEDLVQNFGVPQERCRYLPNAAPDVQLRHTSRRSRDGVQLLAVGRLDPQKDFGTLLRAFAKVHKRFPCRLTILGHGPQRALLETQARDLGIAEHVTLAGQVSGTGAYYEAADVFVLSSLHEGMSNALMEAMASGVAIVATDVSGVRDLICSDEQGVIVPPGDEHALAQALCSLIQDPSCRDRLARAGQERIRKFQVRDIGPQYAAVFSQLIPSEDEE